MSEEKKTRAAEEAAEEILEETSPETQAGQPEEQPDPMALLQQELDETKDRLMRTLAEYDNFRKRTQKEREALYTDIKAETVGKFLPVFDNLQRALAQQTADEAYKKGVEMTMTGLMTIMESLGVTSFGQVGEPFDPNFHNAVMQRDDENFGESTICEVFQTGFKVGEKVVRHAMVVVAN
jgi:molecular chaperone GrpE